MTSVKEPMCFQPRHWVERLPKYRELFGEVKPARGESSTGYSAWPWMPDIPDRVRATVPDAKIVYVVRDPIPRTLSHYAQNVWNAYPVRPFDELMADLEHPMNMPVWASRYATQLERWTQRFGDDQVLVLDNRTLLTDREDAMRQVFEFLGVDPSFTSSQWDVEHNKADYHRVPTEFTRRLGRAGRLGVRTKGVRRMLTREIPRPELRPEQRERLVGILAPEADRLRAMTGLPTDHWSL